jgi:hypothetical protein
MQNKFFNYKMTLPKAGAVQGWPFPLGRVGKGLI